MRLPNKIKNLNKIKKLVKVPNYFYFNFIEYSKNKEQILKTITKKFKNYIIIRSASFLEDKNISNAGKYLSVPNIKSNNIKKIDQGICAVFDSYGGGNNQFILIQEYIKYADTVGVIFTADPTNGSPFININFNESRKTDLITSGRSNGKIVTFFKYRVI